MGSYYDLSVAGYQIASGKNYVAGEWAALFQNSDRDVCQTIIPSHERSEHGFEPGDDEIIRTSVEFRAPVCHIIDRLEVMGYSLPVAKKEFKEGVHRFREEYAFYDQDWMRLPRNFTFARWANSDSRGHNWRPYFGNLGGRE